MRREGRGSRRTLSHSTRTRHRAGLRVSHEWARARTSPMLGRYSSAIRAACATERSCGSVRGAISDGRPYRDPKQNARRKSRAFYQSGVQEVFLLIINSLDNRENFPLSIGLRKRYVINPMWSDEFGGSNVSRNIQHTYLFRPLRLGKVRSE